MGIPIPSVRSRSGTSTPRRTPDSNLVGIRYEKTVQAKPPIPLPPRNPSRIPVRTPSTRSPTPSSPSSSLYSPSLYSYSHSSPGVVVVVAPPLPTVAPPAEQHPALRTPVLQTKLAQEGWKRDSGHAPTSPNSSTTIHEEECEDDCADGKDNSESSATTTTTTTAAAAAHAAAPWSARIDALIKAGVVPQPPSPPAAAAAAVQRQTEHRTSDGPAPTGFSGGDSPRHEAVCCAPAAIPASPSSLTTLNTFPTAEAKTTTTSLQHLSRHQSSPPSSSPSSLSSSLSSSSQKRRNILKRFSARSSASSKGKLPLQIIATPTTASTTTAATATTTSEGSAANAAAPMQQPLMRGSQPPPASANKQPDQLSPSSATETETSSLQSWPASQSQSPAASCFAAERDALFTPLGISIPTEELLDDDFMASLSFSNRGSIMFGGRRVSALGLDGANDVDVADDVDVNAAAPAPLRQQAQAGMTSISKLDSDNAAAAAPRAPLPPPDIRILTADVERESQKVRSLYGVGDTINWEDGARHSFCEPLSPTPEVPAEEDGNDPTQEAYPVPAWGTSRSASSFSHHPNSGRRETELAGGLEDWEDVDGADVDRYGFISAPRGHSRTSTPTDPRSAQLSPRRRNVLQKKDPMGFSSPLSVRRAPSRKVSSRSLNTQNSGISTASKRSSRSVIRQASNLLPHNRDRRWMDEAGDMLTVAPSLQDAEEEAQVERISENLKRKEWERSEKWRKMAKVVRKGGQGEGMEFDFDIKNPKLIERTWKGIPDRWRAAAWWSFLAASAKEDKDAATEEDIIADFHRLLERGSPDDVQIDLDVPRTISRHIMFRKRYRGGQRLLFRVLHALSIYFPETGYVQGMASLAATLLCYFDEEKCFVMLVRMWQLRGLDRLYRPGFEGLMTALREFDDIWINKDVAKKLSDLSVDITAYGTRWYLTLFNLSIPFPAQLRVWDVFLLMPSNQGTGSTSGLDVLHATSAALIQALREVLLDSDFENAMKALTSWIPIKDEDLLMKVAKAEWKTRQGKKKT